MCSHRELESLRHLLQFFLRLLQLQLIEENLFNDFKGVYWVILHTLVIEGEVSSGLDGVSCHFDPGFQKLHSLKRAPFSTDGVFLEESQLPLAIVGLLGESFKALAELHRCAIPSIRKVGRQSEGLSVLNGFDYETIVLLEGDLGSLFAGGILGPKGLRAFIEPVNPLARVVAASFFLVHDEPANISGFPVVLHVFGVNPVDVVLSVPVVAGDGGLEFFVEGVDVLDVFSDVPVSTTPLLGEGVGRHLHLQCGFRVGHIPLALGVCCGALRLAMLCG